MPTTFTLTRTLACTFCLIALLASNASGQIGFPLNNSRPKAKRWTSKPKCKTACGRRMK